MAEIPEHLLRRSKERRAALSGEDAPAEPGGESAPAGEAAVPAKTEAAAPAEPLPRVSAAPPPEPKGPPVDYLPPGRRRMSMWGLPVMAVLPFFAFFYAQAFQNPPLERPTDPLVLGEEIYRSAGLRWMPRRNRRRRRRTEARRGRGRADVPRRGRPHRLGQHRLASDRWSGLRRPEPRRRPARRDRRHARLRQLALSRGDRSGRRLRARKALRRPHPALQIAQSGRSCHSRGPPRRFDESASKASAGSAVRKPRFEGGDGAAAGPSAARMCPTTALRHDQWRNRLLPADLADRLPTQDRYTVLSGQSVSAYSTVGELKRFRAAARGLGDEAPPSKRALSGLEQLKRRTRRHCSRPRLAERARESVIGSPRRLPRLRSCGRCPRRCGRGWGRESRRDRARTRCPARGVPGRGRRRALWPRPASRPRRR